MTSNRYFGVMTGFLITAIVQSSSATTVMTVSFVNAGLLTLVESAGVMMPNMDGIEACIKIREIPEISKTIITFLSARSEDYSQISGLNAGADDYLTKPVRPRVLLSKVKSLLRRLEDTSTEKPQVFKDITIDPSKYKVLKGGVEIKFAKKEFKLLQLLFSDIGKVFTRDEIMNTIWGTDVFVGDRTIDVHIRKLREKLGDNVIETIKGVGYRLSE